MKHYLISLMALFAPLTFSEEVTTPKEIVTYEAMCYDTKILFNGLKITHKEYPILAGKADDVAQSTMSLWIHPRENNWTIVATKGNLSCVIGSGTDFKLMPYKKNSSV
jgi:hypothetical protein